VAISYLDFSRFDSNTDGGSTTVTIPAGATIGIILDQFWGANSGTEGKTESVTVDGQSATLTIQTDRNKNSPYDVGMTLGYVTGFATGTGKTVTWDYTGVSNSMSEGAHMHILWFSGVDLTSPFISSGSDYQQNADAAAVTLTSARGEFCIYAMQHYGGGSTFKGLTLLGVGS